MAPNVFAVCMIVGLLLLPLLLVRGVRRSWLRAVLALVAGGLVFAVVAIAGIHMCGSGHPTTLAVECGLLAMTISITVRSKLGGVVGLVALLLVGAGLGRSYAAFVHEDGVTGNPDWGLLGRQSMPLRIMSDTRLACGRRLRRAADTGEALPAGALPALGADCDRVVVLPFKLVVFWHSALTGLYGVTSAEYRLVSPGGPPAAVEARLRWERVPEEDWERQSQRR